MSREHAELAPAVGVCVFPHVCSFRVALGATSGSYQGLFAESQWGFTPLTKIKLNEQAESAIICQ